MTGIITYHFAHNYGAMLQAYALFTFLKKYGEDVEIINYCPSSMYKFYSMEYRYLGIKEGMFKYVNNFVRKKQYDIFETFRKKRLLNNEIIAKEELASYSKKFNRIIVGSDQVWNTDINFGDKSYFLDFASDKTKKIAYAVSAGSIKTSSYKRECIHQAINSFDRISFRESSTSAFYDELYHLKYPTTCDPVFLLGLNDWRDLEKKPKSFSKKKYILYYSLENDDALIECTRKISFSEGIPIVSVHPLCKKSSFADYNLRNVGPEEFIWLVDNAEYIASNSFHATAFSILFNKKAILHPHPSLGNRNIDLLNQVDCSFSIDNLLYSFTNKNINCLRDLIEYSKRFLLEKESSLYAPINTDNRFHIEVYGLKCKDESKRMLSQSGGAATVLAECFLQKKAIVYGVGFDDKCNAVYRRITDAKDISSIKGSKYVRAYLGSTFNDVKNDLCNGDIVLFIGTTCIVNGLINYVSKIKNKENLFTIDLICHGTPSHELYKEYIFAVQKKYNKKVKKFNFRYKDIDLGGWKKHFEKITFEDDSSIISNKYTDLFYTNLGLRPCCETCKYASYNRISDFTVGDYWGVENASPDFFDNIGVSIIYLNNIRALETKKYLYDNCYMEISDIQKSQQPNTIMPTPVPSYRVLFWKCLKKYGFSFAYKRFIPCRKRLFFVRKKVYEKLGWWI